MVSHTLPIYKPPACLRLGTARMRDHLAHQVGQHFAVEIGERGPAHAGRRSEAAGRVRDEHEKLEREMREYMAHDAGNAAPDNLVLLIGEKIGVIRGRRLCARSVCILPRETGEGSHAQHGGGGKRRANPVAPLHRLIFFFFF